MVWENVQGAGSSPLTRGKRASNRRKCREIRLIPAHAGKTFEPGGQRLTTQAHPRSRGENYSELGNTPSMTGSSPLTRGKLTSASTASSPARLIPAHAGKTGTPIAVNDRLPAHPRSRGENPACHGAVDSRPGSSPLTRGKLALGAAVAGGCGLIPAHAGKTAADPRHAHRRQAHPRSRGENTAKPTEAGWAGGSSPLTRGKLDALPVSETDERLIPAHAGKTRGNRQSARPDQAHPRSRGENVVSNGGDQDNIGSSPLTRGKQSIAADPFNMAGLIPAHAGKTKLQAGRAPR